MEASDAFASPAAADDPFAGTGFGDWEPESAAVPPPAADLPGLPDEPASTLPVVNREGVVVDPGAAIAAAAPPPPAESAAAAAPPAPADAPRAAPTAAEPPPAPLPAGTHASPAAAEADAAAYRARVGEPEPAQAPERFTPVPAAEQAPAAPPAPVEQTAAVVETPPPVERPVDPAPGTAVEAPPEAQAVETPEQADAEAPTAKGLRKYVILQVDGPGKFSQVFWYVNDKGAMVPKGPNTRRQGIALVNGQEQALKIGYMAVGSPPDGASFVATAALYFVVKKVKPKPPEPSRQRLSIS